MIIAIDGPAGSGKSTVAKALARREGFTYLDTGAMYRAVTWKCLSSGVDTSNEEAVTKVARKIEIAFEDAGDAPQRVTVDGRDVTRNIRTPLIDKNVSRVSAMAGVRKAMVDRQRMLASDGDVVAEGRDIGTTVFPDAEVKVFLTADVTARAHRRAVQQAGGDVSKGSGSSDEKTERSVALELERRDKLDSTRKESPLRAAEDATHIDSSTLSVDEVVSAILDLVEKARGPKEPEAAAVEREPRPEPETAPTEEKEPTSESVHAGGAGDAKGDDSNGHSKMGLEDYYVTPMREFPALSRAFHHVIFAIVGLFSKILWRWRIEDKEKLYGPTQDRGAVIVMNHVSMLDPVVIVIGMWFHHRRVRILYKSEFDKHPIVTWFFSRVGGIPLARGTADLKAIRRAQHALQKGESLLIYPEGTRIRTDDQSVTIHGGFSLVAQLAKADVIPVAIVGARQITPEGTHLKRFGNVYCKAGDAISFDSLEAKGRKERLAEMESKAMEAVYALRAELRDEHPGKE